MNKIYIIRKFFDKILNLKIISKPYQTNFAIRYLPKMSNSDENWGGFGGNTGDNFEKPFFHIEGGIGLFGSAAMNEVGFTVFSAGN